jgi:hypothetical protein
MNSGRTIFSQIMNYLPAYEFRQCVERYSGNYKIKSFSCWDQFLSMTFAQLTYKGVRRKKISSTPLTEKETTFPGDPPKL